MPKIYRAERRNAARAAKIKFPWRPSLAKYRELPPHRPNERDRTDEAQERRDKHVTMDFTDGVAGISRALINHKVGTIFKKKPKRKWAAQRRAAKFETFLKGEKLERAMMRHQWYRKQKLREMRADNA